MLINILLSALTALLASLAWYDITSLGLLVMFVPLLYIQKRCSAKAFTLYSLLAIVLWNSATTWWVAKASAIGVVAGVGTTSVLFGAVMWLYSFVSQRAPRKIAYIILVMGWIAAEYLYLNGEISFPWIVIGNGFAIDTALVQWYEYTGALGGSLWALVVNLLLFELLYKGKEGRLPRAIKLGFFTLVPIIISLVMYYSWEEDEVGSVQVAILQPNIDPYNEKFGGLTPVQQLDIMLGEAAKAPANTQLFLAPETALDGASYWISRLDINGNINRVKRFIYNDYPNAKFITGITLLQHYSGDAPAPTTTARKGDDFYYDVYNSAIKIGDQRVEEIYHKSKLVIGVEMLPYHEYLKFIESLSVDLGGIAGMLGTQEERTTFGVANSQIGTAICYESVYGEYYRDFVLAGAQAMTIITNDGWWGNTPGYNQHLSYAKLRAIETRRAIARSANTGISAMVNSRGDITQQLGWDERGIINGQLPLSNKVTFFVANGDVVGRLSSFIFALALLFFIAYHRKKRDYLYH